MPAGVPPRRVRALVRLRYTLSHQRVTSSIFALAQAFKPWSLRRPPMTIVMGLDQHRAQIAERPTIGVRPGSTARHAAGTRGDKGPTRCAAATATAAPGSPAGDARGSAAALGVGELTAVTILAELGAWGGYRTAQIVLRLAFRAKGSRLPARGEARPNIEGGLDDRATAIAIVRHVRIALAARPQRLGVGFVRFDRAGDDFAH